MKTTLLTPLAAVGTALAVFACCVPLGLAGAAGVLALSSLLDALQPWFLGLAVILLALGAFQCFRGQKTCRRKRSRVSLSVLGLSAAVVVLVLIFPQTVAGWIADYYLASSSSSRARATPAVPPFLADLSDVQSLKTAFNQDAAKTRVIMLLSPSCPYCLNGASEIQRVLVKHAGRPVALFVVWQPILPTDWGRPRMAALRRLSSEDVRHFWDSNHLIAAALKESSQGRALQPNCCVEKGIWWDLMAAFPPGAVWTGSLPEPILLDGTVEDAAPAFDALLGN